MPRLSPATTSLALLLADCGPNDVILSTMQYGGNLTNAALNSLHDATDEDEPIDPERYAPAAARPAPRRSSATRTARS